MSDICVIYLSEDKLITGKLVSGLRKYWSVWWAEDINHGSWEESVRKEIETCTAVVPILSQNAKGKRNSIIRDEMHYADKKGKVIFPFLIGNADVPFGFGGYNHTEAHGWNGDTNHPGFQQLIRKISSVIPTDKGILDLNNRQEELNIRRKALKLPAFVFSLSSHETQVNPKDGSFLLHSLGSPASLISSYDIWKYYSRDRAFKTNFKKMRNSQNILFMDSGNYEACRKNDRYSKESNPNGWHREHFWDVVLNFQPDIAFSFDNIDIKGSLDKIIDKTVREFELDDAVLKNRDFSLCPIVHLPDQYLRTVERDAAFLLSGIAERLDPLMLAIPERELGEGLLQRVRSVRAIRKSLNALGKYYPLHILGTGNPLSVIALSAAGADSFDGLEWCRTVVDYGTGFLFHFQQFDFFKQSNLNRIQDQAIKHVVENPNTPYVISALSYNIDYFKDLTRTMQNVTHSGQTELLLRTIPYIFSDVNKEVIK